VELLTMKNLTGLTVHDHLANAAVPLRASASFGHGLAGALWDRDEAAISRYETPSHHTLSLYVSGGVSFRRRLGDGYMTSFGAGSLCLMPEGLTSEWEVSGPVQMLHLYVSKAAFQRAVVETTGADPAHVTLREVPYFQDPTLETVMRQIMLPLNWDEPAERVAVSHGAQTLLAYLVSRMTEHGPRALQARGGLPAAVLRRLQGFVEAHLDQPLSIGDLATCANLSPYHFARAFKRSTGESPHAYVLRRRIGKAKEALAAGRSLAETASLCGFSSQSHFTERFRAQTGVTPGQFWRSTRLPD
jgi:AraC family transcriptional regulator